MENRERIVADYLKLRVLLNRSNFKRNEKTELDFRFETVNRVEIVFVATLRGVGNAKFLVLCKWGKNRGWQESNVTGLYDLEKYCADFFRMEKSGNKSMTELSVLVTKLKIQLRSLGIP